MHPRALFRPGTPRSRTRKPLRVALALAALLITLVLPGLSPGTLQAPTSAPGIGNLPLAFVQGLAEAAEETLYAAHARGASVKFGRDGLTLKFAGAAPASTQCAPPASRTLQVSFVGSSPTAGLQSGDLLPGKVSYYKGNDPSKWLTNLPTYRHITYTGLYPGIDLRYEGDNGHLKGTYLVAPNADPSPIRWSYSGHSGLSVDGEGNLQIPLVPDSDEAGAKVTEQKPVAWQEIGGERVPVDVRYIVQGSVISFELGSYDRSKPLVIDPTLTYSSYFGTSDFDEAAGMGLDGANNVYLAGSTNVQDDFWDIIVAKFSPDGQTLLYQWILGGTREDRAAAIDVDSAGNTVVLGNVTSANFPLLNPLQNQNRGSMELTITKLDAVGTLVWSTYLGSTGADAGSDIMLDGSGNVYLTGGTDIDNYPTVNAFQPNIRGMVDGFISEINSAGTSLVFSTFFGGSYNDELNDIWVGGSNNLYVTGFTRSLDFPTQNAYQPTPSGDGDAFVTKFTPNAQGLVWSTYLGGNDSPRPGEDHGNIIRTNAQGNVYVVGNTESPNFPTTPGAFQRNFHGGWDLFVTEFTPDGQALVFSTFLGGSLNWPYGQDLSTDMTLDSAGYIYVTGSTYSPDFPIRNAVQPVPGDRYDAFVTKFLPDGSDLAYSTYLGGDYSLPDQTGDDIGRSIKIDSAGNAVIAGTTSSWNFPTVNAYQYQIQAATDFFISKISDQNPPPTPTMTGTPPTATRTSTPIGTATRFPTFTPTATVTPICGGGPFTVTGSIDENDTTATSSVYLDEVASTCATPKTCPGALEGDPVAFDQYRFTNTTGSSQCITVHLDGSECGPTSSVVSAAYLGSFDPANACANYLADGGTDAFWFTGPVEYSFTVPAGATFAVIVEELNSEVYCEQYTLSVTGLSGGCPTATSTPVGGPPSATATRTAVGSTTPAATTTACTISFSDVQPGSTFYPYVMCLACKGIINGYPDGTFQPNNPLTRGQLSKIVAISANFIEPVKGQAFEDVAPGSTFYAYIGRMAGRGIIQGYPCGGPGEPCGTGNRPYFRPNANTTRGQIAKIVTISAGFAEPITGQAFEDVPPTHTFYEYIERLASRGYIGGYACGGPGEPCDPSNRPYFRPGNGATRGQPSKIVSQAFFPECATR